MYGLVNKALQDMVQRRFGKSEWDLIRQKAAVDIEVFVSNHDYHDDVTYALAGASSHILGMPTHRVLQDFGRHWVLTTALEGYGELLEAGGHSFPEFLENLPNFHARVCLIFPHLKPPRFKCSDVTNHSLLLHYYSHRSGMAPFVIGLLEGLGAMFHTAVQVSHEVARGADSDHDVFRISWAGGEA